MNQNPNNEVIIKKIESYCAYQDRCHQEVTQKLKSMLIDSSTLDEIIVHLIQNKFLNEERFACSFARGKHRIKSWGNIRIINELKARNITQTNIKTALKEITTEEYFATFENLSARVWENITEKNELKKRKKFCDYLLRKGYESQLVYEKVKELEKSID
ncbi:MAG: RecX family transcriptional regulator [Flavobacterium sp.]|nr:RecX family transcriptional regulator [Flavobacterium sp.]